MAWTTRPTYAACIEPPSVPIGTLPIGYEVTLPNLTLGQPLMLIDRPPGIPLPPSRLGEFRLGLAPLGPSRDPWVGAFIRDSGLIAGTLGELSEVHYVPASTPDGRIGRFAIGRSPIGWRRSSHKAVTIGAPPGHGETEAP